MGRFIPRGIEPHGGRGKAAQYVLLACALLAAAPGGLFAQAADNVRTFHVPARSFNIPFNTDNDPRIVDVILYVSTDGKQYTYVDTVKPSAHKFYFAARGDGWYSFIVQTRDQGGVLRPPDLREVAPSIRVYVDTQSPVIEELAPTPPEEGYPVGIRWKINKANLQEIWADYRSTSGGEWLPLFLPLKAEGTYPWKPAFGGELEVRMQALDKAGHRSEVKTLRMKVADKVSRMPPPDEPLSNAGKVMHVKSKTFQLQYQLDNETVGPSKVASVDIWKLHQGRGWQKCRETGTATGPATVTVDATGRWGFRLIPRSGVGLAERDPQSGDSPDIWVEVDDKPPQVKVTNVTVTQEPDGGYLTVYWKADDTFLRSMPITILLSTNQGREWKPVAAELPNTGSWRYRTDDLKLGEQYEFLLKVSAIDEAGNVGSDQWREVVKVDLKIPRIKVIKVQPSGAAPADGQEAYRSSQSMPSFNGLPGAGLPVNNSSPSRQTPSPMNGTGGGYANPMGP
jgi:hypothetical protein